MSDPARVREDRSELDELLSQAAVRRLSEAELDALARLASADGSVGQAIGRLINAGPTGALNLRHASLLRRMHAERVPSGLPSAPPRRGSMIETRSGPYISFSTHAVEQYMVRVRPDLTFDQAASELASEAEGASRMRARTASGEEQWLCRSGAVLVVKRDGPGAPGACVTVLRHDMNIRR